MNKPEIIEKVTPVIEKASEDSGLILLETDLVKESGKWVLRIFIYNPEKPITHQDCENITRKIDSYLEEIITIPFSIEVSSPGLERKLKSYREYEIFRGKRVKIKLKNGDILISELNARIIEKYKNGDISYTKLEPEYKHSCHPEERPKGAT